MNEEISNIENKDDKTVGFRAALYFQLPKADDRLKEISEGVENLKLNSNFMTPNLTPRTSDPKTFEFYKNCISNDLLRRLEESSPIKFKSPGFNRKISEIFLLNCEKDEIEQVYSGRENKEMDETQKDKTKNAPSEINEDENPLDLKNFTKNTKNYLPKSQILDDSNYSPLMIENSNNFVNENAINLNLKINKNDSPRYQKTIKYADSKSSPIYNYYQDSSENFYQHFGHYNMNNNEKNHCTDTTKKENKENTNKNNFSNSNEFYKIPDTDHSNPQNEDFKKIFNNNVTNNNLINNEKEINNINNFPILRKLPQKLNSQNPNKLVSESSPQILGNPPKNCFNKISYNFNQDDDSNPDKNIECNKSDLEKGSEENSFNKSPPYFMKINQINSHTFNEKNQGNIPPNFMDYGMHPNEYFKNSMTNNHHQNSEYVNNNIFDNSYQGFLPPNFKSLNNEPFKNILNSNMHVQQNTGYTNESNFNPPNGMNSNVFNMNNPNLDFNNNEQMKNQFWQKNFGKKKYNNNFPDLMKNNNNSKVPDINGIQSSSKYDPEEYIVEMFGKRGWICDACNNFNYETRTKCNRCGIMKIPKKITNRKNKFNANNKQNKNEQKNENNKMKNQNDSMQNMDNFNSIPNQTIKQNLDTIPNNQISYSDFSEKNSIQENKPNPNDVEQTNEILNTSNNSSDKKNKKPFVERVGDWVCIKCKNLNFSFRVICNRCQMPKYESDRLFEEYMSNLVNYVKFNEMMQNRILMNQPGLLMQNQGFINNNNINISNNFYNNNDVNCQIPNYVLNSHNTNLQSNTSNNFNLDESEFNSISQMFPNNDYIKQNFHPMMNTGFEMKKSKNISNNYDEKEPMFN